VHSPVRGAGEPHPGKIETAPARTPPLLIDNIETIPLRIPLDRVYKGSYYSMQNRTTIITRVHTRDGLIGECYNGDTDDEQQRIVGVISHEIAPRLAGCDAWNIEGCWERMLPVTFDILRNRAHALQAMACVDSALWDLAGKAVGQPLSRLWGGYRDALPINVIGGYYSDAPNAVEREADRFVELGFGGCKFKVGGRSPEEDADRIRRLRATVGPEFVVTVDANQGYSLDEAVKFARLAQEHDLTWFEEPCRWSNDRLGMRDVRAMTGIPVCAGQSEITPAGARDLIQTGAIDVCNLDASWSGGPTAWRRVAGMASLYGVRMGHHEESQIAAHLLSAISHGTFLEVFLPERDPIFWNLIENRAEIKNGAYPVPQGPGWGLHLDEKLISRTRLDT
jgi:D-arabinonate dehydratase